MLFSRKNPATWAEWLRIMLWPRRSWLRSAKYISKRILRLTASPHAIAAGVAAGVFASFTPFVGFHFIIAFAVAYFIAGNFIAAASGTFFGNPLTFPFIWTSTYKLGNLILSGESPEIGENKLASIADADWIELGLSGIWDKILGIWEPVVKPMLIGSVPLGVVFGICAYMFTRWASVKFNEARKRRKLRKKQQVPVK
ncbi:MAG: DUF2062 domain-containing protein [Pseudomonadota bacterium]